MLWGWAANHGTQDRGRQEGVYVATDLDFLACARARAGQYQARTGAKTAARGGRGWAGHRGRGSNHRVGHRVAGAFQREYLDTVEDLIHWQSIPMIAAPAAGVLFGVAGGDALTGAFVGSTAGLLAGAAVGAGIGWLAATTSESPWRAG